MNRSAAQVIRPSSPGVLLNMATSLPLSVREPVWIFATAGGMVSASHQRGPVSPASPGPAPMQRVRVSARW